MGRKRRRQIGGRKKKKSSGGVGKAALKGVFKPSLPGYGDVLNPFAVRYAQPQINPQLMRGKASVITPMRLETSQKMQNPDLATTQGVNVVIKGKPVLLYSKARRVVPTVR